MEGMNLNVQFSLLNKLDDIVFSIIKQIEEQNKREKKEQKKDSDEDPNKAEQLDQNHMLQMLAVILKAKLSAKFNLSYVQDFQNNFLSMLDESYQQVFTITPSQAHPVIANLREIYDNIGTNEDIDAVTEALIDTLYEIFESLGFNPII